MGKKQRSWMRWLPRPTARDFYKALVIQSAYLTAGGLYWRTLEGGDVDYLKEQVSYFAVLLLSSMALIALATKGAAAAYSSWSLRIVNWVLGGLILGYMLTRDLGTTLETHGQYNFILYLLMWQPILLTMVLSRLCRVLRRLASNDKL
jgi:hypothetical protein